MLLGIAIVFVVYSLAITGLYFRADDQRHAARTERDEARQERDQALAGAQVPRRQLASLLLDANRAAGMKRPISGPSRLPIEAP